VTKIAARTRSAGYGGQFCCEVRVLHGSSFSSVVMTGRHSRHVEDKAITFVFERQPI